MRHNNLQFLLILLLSLFGINASAQHNVTIQIATPGEIPFKTGELCVQDSTEIKYFAIIESSRYSFTLPQTDTYTISLSSLGHEFWETKQKISTDTIINISLQDKGIFLEEVVAVGKSAPKQTAIGSIYKLSNNAKKSGDPFIALSEIPILKVDPINQSISTSDGSSPLVLIDGKLLNTGLQPIDPKFIESVEITEVVSAKYLKLGVNKVLNIKLKRDVPLYMYVDARTRHDIPLQNGFIAANFEVGKPKFAIYGTISGDYTHHAKVGYTSREKQFDNIKFNEGENRTNLLGWDAQVHLKWLPTKSDYFSVAVKAQDYQKDINGYSHGFYNNPDTQRAMATNSKTKKNYGGWLTAAFYEHTFNENSNLTAFFKYNCGKSKTDERFNELFEKTDEYPLTDNNYWNYSDRTRNQYTFSLDYDNYGKSFGNISAGYFFEYTNDQNADLTVDPNNRMNVKRLNNYIHATYMNRWKKLHYMASLGLEHMHTKVLDANSTWWRPRASASLTLALPMQNTIRFSYKLTSYLPHSEYLAILDKSTNPWIRNEGNPYLTPEMVHLFKLNYDKWVKNVGFQFEGGHSRSIDNINPYMFNDGDITVHTYRNFGHHIQTMLTGRFFWQTRNVTTQVSGSYLWEKFDSQDTKGSVIVDASVRWFFGKFYLISSVGWQNRYHNRMGYSEPRGLANANIQLGWRPTKQIFVAVGIPYFWGTKKNKSFTEQGGYSIMTTTEMKTYSMRPWLLFSYTLRKNAKSAIDDKMPQL